MVQFRGFQVHIWGVWSVSGIFFGYPFGSEWGVGAQQGVRCILRTVSLPPKKKRMPRSSFVGVHSGNVNRGFFWYILGFFWYSLGGILVPAAGCLGTKSEALWYKVGVFW